jgi:hypothetical protein
MNLGTILSNVAVLILIGELLVVVLSAQKLMLVGETD